MGISKDEWVTCQKLYTQCVIEARNISFGLSISLKYRLEMIIGLLEVSLANIDNTKS